MRVSLVIDAFGLGARFMWAERSLTDAKRSVPRLETPAESVNRTGLQMQELAVIL